MPEIEPCQFLSWDTEFFGFRIARVMQNKLSPHLVSEILSWCSQNSIECLYFLADSDDANTVRLAEKHNFSLTDIRVSLEFHRSSQHTVFKHPEAIVRPWISSDLPVLVQIARNSFRMTRFYYDDCFPRDACDRLYETWIRNSCQGYADLVLVAEHNEKVVGFITCNLETDSSPANIGLIAVASGSQGNKIGYLLVNNALDTLITQGIERVNVVTQSRNIASQRLYQRCGFVTESVQLWYHKWFTSCN